MARHSTSEENSEPQVLIVVGSWEWTNETIVWAVLDDWWDNHSRAPVVLVTSNTPQGAEKFARNYAESKDWRVISTADQDLATVSAPVLAFIKDGSEGATALVKMLIHTMHWVREIRDDTSRTTSPWITR